MKFTYKARTKDGKPETGTIEASSKDAAAVLLKKYDIFVTSLQELASQEPFFKKITFEPGIAKKDLVVFSRQLALMLDSRVPVVQSLSTLAFQTTNVRFKKIVADIAKLVEEGVFLSQAMARFPKVFDNFYVNLIKSGEVSGNISQTLYYVSDNIEREYDLTSQVRQALIYPVFTLGILFVVVNIIIVFLLPKIQELIKESSSAPPLFTVIMLDFYTFLQHFWWVIVLMLFLCIATAFMYVKTERGKKIYDTLLLYAPFLGSILRKVFLTRFCGNISTLLSSGVSINKALQITADTVDNLVYKDLILAIESRVSQGEKISSALLQHPIYFPSFVVAMIKVGEQTGKLDKTLMEIVNFYQKEIKRSVALFLTLLEPILIIFLGVIVGVLAISVFTPLYSALGDI